MKYQYYEAGDASRLLALLSEATDYDLCRFFARLKSCESISIRKRAMAVLRLSFFFFFF
jgi:hypothetical protein